MLVLAKSLVGQEYLYNPKTAHAVSKASAQKIADICNRCKYQLKDGETWFLHEVDEYDSAFAHAHYRKFTIRKGIVKDVPTMSYYNIW